jgi:hypothetical protein
VGLSPYLYEEIPAMAKKASDFPDFTYVIRVYTGDNYGELKKSLKEPIELDLDLEDFLAITIERETPTGLQTFVVDKDECGDLHDALLRALKIDWKPEGYEEGPWLPEPGDN